MQIVAKRNYIPLIAVLCAAIMAMLFPVYSTATVQLGGWLSSKVFERTGTADSNLLLARDGATDTLLIMASAPAITTTSATGATISGVTGAVDLNGNLDSLNIMPSADVGFRWGYASGTMTNYTPTTHKTSTGTFTYHLTGYDPLKTVYYQAVGTSDGVGYGIGDTFATPKAIDALTGFEPVILITPLLLWVAALVISIVSFTVGIRSDSLTAYVGIGIGIIMLTIDVLCFPLIINTIEQIRLIP